MGWPEAILLCFVATGVTTFSCLFMYFLYRK